MKHNLLKSLIISVILVTGVSNAWGSVVGVAGSNPHNYTVKINVQRTYTDNGKDWFQQNMAQAPKGMTFEGKKLYIIGYENTNMDGVEQMQFQYYDGNSWKEEVKAIGEWQTSKDNAHPYGYIYNYDEKKWYENGDFVSGFNFYFDATGWEQTTLHMCIGHAYWHTYDHLTKIPDTNLYYCTRKGWGGASGLCVVGNTSEANHTQGDLLSISQNATEFSGFRNYILKSAGNTAYLMVNKGNAGQMPDMYYYDNFSSLNHTQTIKTVVDGTIANSKANIAIQSYKMTGNGKVTEQNNSLTTSSNTATISAARTATTTLIVSNIADDYKFDGWYDQANGGKKLSGDKTYTYYPTEANTIYARFTQSPPRIIYFKPNADWLSKGSRFVAHWWNEISVADEMTQVECSDYYTYPIPGEYSDYKNILFTFVKDNADVFDSFGDIDWEKGKTSDLLIPNDGNNLYDMASGQWTKYTATVPVKLIADSHGTYTITDGTESATSALDDNKTITNLPLNTKIKILNQTPQPGYAQTHGAAITIGSTPKQAANLDQEYTICGPTTITGNFVSTDPTTVYLEPTGIWNQDGAVYRAYVFHDTGNAWTKPLKELTGSNGKYYTVDLPAGYHSVIFCRVNPSKNNPTTNEYNDSGIEVWNKTDDLLIPVNSTNNVYEITAMEGGTYGNSQGSWKSVTCTVQLGWCKFGRFGFEYNGTRHYSKEYADVFVDVPLGEQITILSEPANTEYYTCDVMNRHREVDGKFEIIDIEKPFTVGDNVLLDDDFLLTKDITVYIGVPTEQLKVWRIDNDSYSNPGAYYIWRDNDRNQGNRMTMTNEDDRHQNEWGTVDGITYYQMTIKKGCNEIQFQIKKDGGIDLKERAKTQWIKYQIPLTDLNCYVLDGTQTDDCYNGYWTRLPQKEQDYRLLYIEQQVELGDDGHPRTTVTKEHPSDIVRYSNSANQTKVSLHIFNEMQFDGEQLIDQGKNDPEILLQQWNGSEWETKQRHMVFGPLHANFGMAAMPGRRNTGEDPDAVLVVDNGIEKIKNANNHGCGVWTFTVYQDGEGNASLDLVKGLEHYEGDYYIRTMAADGGWSNYLHEENKMFNSAYATENFKNNNLTFAENEFFTHSFCKWIVQTQIKDVKFVIANDYGMAISEVFTTDNFTDNGGFLKSGGNANVRFAWNEITNTCKRAYIAGSFEGDEFLVVKNNDNKITLQENTSGKPGYFNDNTNFLYYADVTAQPQSKAQVVAKYDGKYQYFMGADSGTEQYEQLIGGDNNDKTYYPIRILYDFREHRFVVAYLPPNTINKDVAIETPVMILRKNHGEPNQITFSSNEKRITNPTNPTKPAYAAITFTESHITDPKKTQYEKALYWISFPFDVKISDAFGLGEYGVDWILEYYDGARRAKEGLYHYNTFWEYIENPNGTIPGVLENGVLKAGVGYVLCLDLDRVPYYFIDRNNSNEEITLYFPSATNISEAYIKELGAKVVELTSLTGRTPQKDHNWHLIGIPSYANPGQITKHDGTQFLYQYDATNDSYIASDANAVTYWALHAYMVQYAGNITWESYITSVPQAIAARHDSETLQSYTLRLELSNNGKCKDQTFVKLKDGDNITPTFDLNADLPKIINSGSNIYSLITTQNEVIKAAGNVLPLTQDIVIPVGVVIAEAGDYTFAMPDGTAGIEVQLIDYQTNEKTNLLFGDYTINLPKGTFDNRFALLINPDKVATSVDNIGADAEGVKKYIIDGKLYLQRDSELYDAQGQLIR